MPRVIVDGDPVGGGGFDLGNAMLMLFGGLLGVVGLVCIIIKLLIILAITFLGLGALGAVAWGTASLMSSHSIRLLGAKNRFKRLLKRAKKAVETEERVKKELDHLSSQDQQLAITEASRVKQLALVELDGSRRELVGIVEEISSSLDRARTIVLQNAHKVSKKKLDLALVRIDRARGKNEELLHNLTEQSNQVYCEPQHQ